MSAFRDFDRLPELGVDIPKGRGIFEPVDGEARLVQFWYAPQSELSSYLSGNLDQITPERVIDLEPFRCDPSAQAAYTVSDDQSWEADDDQPAEPEVEVVDLGEVMLDLDLDLSELDFDNEPPGDLTGDLTGDPPIAIPEPEAVPGSETEPIPAPTRKPGPHPSEPASRRSKPRAGRAALSGEDDGFGFLPPPPPPAPVRIADDDFGTGPGLVLFSGAARDDDF